MKKKKRTKDVLEKATTTRWTSYRGGDKRGEGAVWQRETYNLDATPIRGGGLSQGFQNPTKMDSFKQKLANQGHERSKPGGTNRGTGREKYTRGLLNKKASQRVVQQEGQSLKET